MALRDGTLYAIELRQIVVLDSTTRGSRKSKKGERGSNGIVKKDASSLMGRFGSGRGSLKRFTIEWPR